MIEYILISMAFIIALYIAGFIYMSDLSVPAPGESRLESIKKLLVIFPHPDDEVLTCGGLIKKLSDKGVEVTYAIMTKGEKGTKDGKFDKKLKSTREKEAKAVSGILGITRLIHYDMGDGELVKNREFLGFRISKLIREESPDLIITYDESGLYGHPDHVAVSEAVLKALEKYKKSKLWYASNPKRELDHIKLPVHMANNKRFAENRKMPNLRIFIGSQMMVKLKALYRYKSQINSFRSAFPRLLPLWFIISMRLYEYYHEAEIIP